MPTKKYRLQIPVSDETRKAVEAYAEAAGLSQAAAVGQILENAAPTMYQLAAALREAHRAPAKALQDAARVLERATTEAGQLGMDLREEAEKKKRK